MSDPLKEFRTAIDAIDDQIIALLKERIEIVKKVGALKKKEAPGHCPIRSGREAAQLRRVAEAFHGNAFSPHAAAEIWRAFINAALNVESHLAICACAADGHNDVFWLAREYFGSYVPIHKEPTPKRTIGQVVDNKVSIGVIPYPATGEDGGWWQDLAGDAANWPKIFAVLPFVRESKPNRDIPQALAIAKLTPEETGNDRSLLAITTEENVSQSKLQTAFAKTKIDATWLDIATTNGGLRTHLVEINTFVLGENELYKNFLNHVGGGIERTVFLGAYAAPLVLE